MEVVLTYWWDSKSPLTFGQQYTIKELNLFIRRTMKIETSFVNYKTNQRTVLTIKWNTWKTYKHGLTHSSRPQSKSCKVNVGASKAYAHSVQTTRKHIGTRSGSSGCLPESQTRLETRWRGNRCEISLKPRKDTYYKLM